MDESSFPFRTEPFKHQYEAWLATRAYPHFGIFWEQGTGKSKLVIDTAAWLFLNNRIDALIIIAPNGVHRNWIVNEIPAHMPAPVKYSSFLYLTSKADTQRFKRQAAECFTAKGLLIVAMSYDSVMTKFGDKFLLKVLDRRCLMVLDESARIKTPTAKRTIRILARGRGATYRRILTGTPVANSPFDIFTQLKFLVSSVWDGIGCKAFSSFKNQFGIWEQKRDPRSGRAYKDLVQYRNLEMLKGIVDQFGNRVTKDDVLDLPPKLYQKRYFDLSAKQEWAYAEMRNEWAMRLDGGEVTAMLAIVRLMRFQQITSGFVVDENERIHELDPVCPRITALREAVGDSLGKMIIWAKFKHDITKIVEALAEDGIEAVRYDGTTGPEDRGRAIERFQNGTARAFVANPAAAGEGLTLTAARTVIYYNNTFKLTERLQSEDRAHRIGQKHSVLYIDIVATDTVDEKITDALRNKLDIASIITGDRLREWI